MDKNIFSRFPGSSSIVLGTLVLMVLVGTSIAIGSIRINTILHEFKQVVHGHSVQADLAIQMRLAMRERLVLLNKISLADDPIEKYERLEQFYDEGSKFLIARNKLLLSDLTDEERLILKKQSHSTNFSAPIHREIGEMLIGGESVNLEKRILNEAFPVQDQTLNLIDQFMALQTAQNQKALYQATGQAQLSFLFMLILSGIAIILGGIGALYMIRKQRFLTFKAEKSQRDLQELNEQLEARVLQRTMQLNEANQRLAELVNKDGLTGLANRVLFIEQLRLTLARARREKSQVAILFLDLDGFKMMNDTLGHDAGDQLLKSMAERLLECVREEDLVARMGGDEFTIMLPKIGSARDAEHVAAKIIQAISRPVLLGGVAWNIGVSIGISIFPQDGQDVSDLLKCADKAMYAVKQKGKNGFLLFPKSIQAGK